MIILSVKANNFYCFENFKIDLSYKKKSSRSLIKYEYLENYDNFKFKKLNILIGSNASGKTVFGKLLSDILAFVENRDNKIIMSIPYTDKEAMFSIDFILNKGKYVLYRVECTIKNSFVKNLKIQSVNIAKKDSYSTITERLKTIYCLNGNNEDFLTPEMMKALKEIDLKANALFCFTDEIISENKIIKYDINVLNTVLKIFDNSIKEITPVENTEDGYLIHFKHGVKMLIQGGEAVKGNILSSGTKEGLSVAYIISEMKKDSNRLFYIDEKFSHIHTDVEKAILSIMTELLGKEAQLFFTTHNLDVLEMSLPNHAFTFFSKKYGEINVIHPEKELPDQNDRNLRGKVENDLFETIPDYDDLFNLVGGVNG